MVGALSCGVGRTQKEGGMTGGTITRADLSEAVYQEVGLSRNESAELVESVLNEISEALVRGEMVTLSSFGSFSVREKGERIGRRSEERGVGKGGVSTCRSGWSA